MTKLQYLTAVTLNQIGKATEMMSGENQENEVLEFGIFSSFENSIQFFLFPSFKYLNNTIPCFRGLQMIQTSFKNFLAAVSNISEFLIRVFPFNSLARSKEDWKTRAFIIRRRVLGRSKDAPYDDAIDSHVGEERQRAGFLSLDSSCHELCSTRTDLPQRCFTYIFLFLLMKDKDTESN